MNVKLSQYLSLSSIRNGKLGHLSSTVGKISSIRASSSNFNANNTFNSSLNEWKRNLTNAKVIKSPFPSLEIPKVTYPQFAMTQMEKFGDKTFVVVCIETGKDLSIGKQGEIWARGPQVMSGYENNPEATNSALVDGWLKTGDIGYVSSEGYLYIVDRLKDFIKVKGHQVAPAELESLLFTHNAVQDVAVIGVPDERAGEVPRAYVVLKDKTTQPEELQKYVPERCSPEKHLVGGVVLIDQIPKSATGKVLKGDLRLFK